MKKNIITIVLVGIIVLPIYGCGNKGKEIVESLEAIEATLEESEETYRTPEQTETQQAEDDKGTDLIYIIEPGLTQDDTYEMQDWQAAYMEYIEEFERKESCYYSLIYVDEDDIPELVIDTGSAAGGCFLVTFHNGVTDILQTVRLEFTYMEKKNLLLNSSGNTGFYFDYIHSIENGQWVYVTGGEYREDHENQTEYYVEYLYEWEGKSVDEEEYKEKIAKIFDREQAIEPEQYERLDEMLFRLQMGTAQSQTHRYELYVEDITWDEAKKQCEEKGGYLAAITTIEEYEHIKKGIEDSGQTQVAYWVGASDNHPSSYPIYEWHEPNRDYMKDIYISYTIMGKYWADGEPSYFKQAADEQIDELGIYLLYDDAKEDCYLYDAPMDMLLRNPEYTGKIGYICEYDSVTVMAKHMHYNTDGSIEWWYKYEYDSAGNQTKYTTFQSDGSIKDWEEYEYDDAGNQVKVTEYNGDGSIKGWEEYKYDSVGNQVENIRYWSDGNIERQEGCEYDSAGNETKHIRYGADGSIKKWYEYEYDSAGNEVKRIRYGADDSIEWWYEYEYDSAGNQVKWIGCDVDGSIMEWYESEYDGAGNRVKWIRCDVDGSIKDWEESEYDSAGNRVKWICCDVDGNIKKWCEYEYDSAGNETRNTGYLSDGSIDYWNVYEYITITPHNEVTISD